MKCVCEERGTVFSGIPGILVGPRMRQGSRLVERCDACQRFSSDESAALLYATKKGGGARYDGKGRAVWWPR